MRTPVSLRASLLAAAMACMLVPLTATTATAAPLPNKFLLSSHFGWEVNKTGANVCTVNEECQRGTQNSGAGGFFNAVGVAVNADPASASFEHVYVADRSNDRVQELTAGGAFVSMFGWDVNRTKVEAAALQAERNVCTAASGDVCQAGVEGAAPGQFGATAGIAVDPASGDVYVSDTVFGRSGGQFALAQRVQKFTAAGQFVLEIGKEVNETTKGNLCVAGEACVGATLRTFAAAEADSEAGAFSFEFWYGDQLAVGGPKDLLYVGDHARVQEFNASGGPAGEVSLAALSATGKATGVAVDPAGNVLVVDSEVPGVHEYNSSGVLQPQVIDESSLGVRGIALDPHGRVGITEAEEGVGHGVLYSASGVKISEFSPPSGEMSSPGLAFAASDKVYVVETFASEVEAYAPIVFPEARTCAVSEVTTISAKACGEINPDGVPATGFFQYGTTQALGSLTSVAFEGEGEVFAPISSQLTGLVPNQAYQYRVAVEAQVNGEKVQGHGEEVAFRTQIAAPQIPGQPSASFVKAQSVVLNASVNPEHITTHYHFEYGACPTLASCTTVQSTPEEVSSVFGVISSTQELVGLAPSTTYSYRLVADNEFEEEPGKTVGGKATGLEGSFTTAAVPTVSAATGSASVVTSTSAVISGAVNPDGQPANYIFELGVSAGSGTQFGVVFSGPTGASTTPVTETLALSGLQPGGTYAYRIVIRGGYGEAVGAPATFTTEGLPAVLTLPPLLAQIPIPPIAFPTETAQVTPRTLTRAQQLARALRACAKKPNRKRAACRRKAEKRYGPARHKK
ncbi:MAG TPA: hypothetical protein VNY27_02945 [Solirubrobacteraceae bacterium]|jgi:hypothetical protein|nr:hypothetical protein [Solirubrobacteraceae bacterium]